jgi:hypothetical protein
MTAHSDGDHEHGSAHDHDEGRSTAPQSEYTLQDVGFGFVVTLVGLIVVFGIPIALTL